jgi:hypothetical protein
LRAGAPGRDRLDAFRIAAQQGEFGGPLASAGSVSDPKLVSVRRRNTPTHSRMSAEMAGTAGLASPRATRRHDATRRARGGQFGPATGELRRG